MKKSLVISIATLGLIATGCSGSSGGGTSASAGAQAVLGMQSKLESLAKLVPDVPSTSSLGNADRMSTRTAIGANWTSSTMPNPTNDGSNCNPGNVSLMEWMGHEFEPDAVRCNGSSINVFGRVKQATMVLCAVLQTQSAASSADLPASGVTTLTFDAATIGTMVSVCGLPAADASMLTGVTGTLTISTPSDTSTFDRKIEISIAGGEIQNDVYLKYDASGSAAVATNENNDNGTTRTIMKYNASTQVLQGEYVSRSAGVAPQPVYVHRVFMDNVNNSARIYSRIDDGTNTIEYNVSGHPTVSSAVAFAVGVTGYGFGAPISGEACVNPETGSITTDNTTTCGSFSSVAVASATAGEDVEATVDGAPTTWNDFATPPALTWSTISDMLTTDI